MQKLKRSLPNNRLGFALAALLLIVSAARASENEWILLATVNADSGTAVKEVAVGQAVSKVTFTCLTGQLTIESVDVVSGVNVYSYKVGNKLTADKTQKMSIGEALAVDKLRIVDSGSGRYEVRVRK